MGVVGLVGRVRTETAVLTALTFVTAELTIEVELTAGGLRGQVVPPATGRIAVVLGDGSAQSTDVASDGWFRFNPPPGEMFRLELTGADATRVRTPWVTP